MELVILLMLDTFLQLWHTRHPMFHSAMFDQICSPFSGQGTFWTAILAHHVLVLLSPVNHEVSHKSKGSGVASSNRAAMTRFPQSLRSIIEPGQAIRWSDRTWWWEQAGLKLCWRSSRGKSKHNIYDWIFLFPPQLANIPGIWYPVNIIGPVCKCTISVIFQERMNNEILFFFNERAKQILFLFKKKTHTQWMEHTSLKKREKKTTTNNNNQKQKNK